jgi:Holliday junction resolvase RusA-like endonuclease
MIHPKAQWQFDIPGIPKAQPRAKAARMGSAVRMYTPTTADQWKCAVANAALAAIPPDRLPIGLGIGLTIVFCLPRPKRLERRATASLCNVPHLSKPDLDNLEKAVLDALKDGGVMVDDCQVFKVEKLKVYADSGELPGASVILSEYGDE